MSPDVLSKACHPLAPPIHFSPSPTTHYSTCLPVVWSGQTPRTTQPVSVWPGRSSLSPEGHRPQNRSRAARPHNRQCPASPSPRSPNRPATSRAKLGRAMRTRLQPRTRQLFGHKRVQLADALSQDWCARAGSPRNAALGPWLSRHCALLRRTTTHTEIITGGRAQDHHMRDYLYRKAESFQQSAGTHEQILQTAASPPALLQIEQPDARVYT